MASNIKYTNDEKYNKHLSLTERITIQSLIVQNRKTNGALSITLKEIGEIVKRDPTTISKELKNRRVYYPVPYRESDPARSNKTCKHYTNCKITGLCSANGGMCKSICKKCSNCTFHCKQYEEYVCVHLTRFPWVCDGCPKRGHCEANKYYYYPEKAYTQYKNNLAESRQGMDLSEEQFKALDNIVTTNLIERKQPLSHIYYSNIDDMVVSLRTLYNYFESGVFTAKNIDLPRKVSYKVRYHQKISSSLKKRIIQGRSYEDFQKLIAAHPDTSIVEMDTVEGIKGGKLLLTMMFVTYKLQLAFLIDSKEAKNITCIFNMLEGTLGFELFNKLFGTILTDNGVEFSNPDALENSIEGKKRCKIYFCHPYASREKGSCEKNHEYIRIVYPKGTSFDNLSQEKINDVMSNINAVIRPEDASAPYTMFSAKYGEKILDMLKIKKIDSKLVCLLAN